MKYKRGIVALCLLVGATLQAETAVQNEFGSITGFESSYKDSTSVTITAGKCEANSEWFYSTFSTDLTLGSIPSGEDFIYIYLDYSASTTNAPVFISSTTEPAWDTTQLGWYNGTDRCVGAAYTPDGSTEIQVIPTTDGALAEFNEKNSRNISVDILDQIRTAYIDSATLDVEKADLTYVDTELADKADVTDIPDISGKADITYVDSEIATVNTALDTKADTTHVNTQLAGKVSNDDFNLALGMKANTTTVLQWLDDKADRTELHSHANKGIIDELGEDSEGDLTYKGTPVCNHKLNCQITLSADQSIPKRQYTTVTWGSESWDKGEFYNPAHPTRLTVPAGGDGLYHITYYLIWTSAVSIDGATLLANSLDKNGSSDWGGGRWLGTTQIPTPLNLGVTQGTSSFHVRLSAGDYIELRVYQNSTDSNPLQKTSYISINRVAD